MKLVFTDFVICNLAYRFRWGNHKGRWLNKYLVLKTDLIITLNKLGVNWFGDS